MDSGHGKRLNAARREGGAIKAGQHLASAIASAKEIGADVVLLDPVVSLHEAKENDNGEMRAVYDLIGNIAVGANCAVLVACHPGKPDKASSKSAAGDAYAIRGGSAQPDAVRVATRPAETEDTLNHFSPGGLRERLARNCSPASPALFGMSKAPGINGYAGVRGPERSRSQAATFQNDPLSVVTNLERDRSKIYVYCVVYPWSRHAGRKMGQQPCGSSSRGSR